MDFEKADYGENRTAASCVVCQQVISQTYFTVNGNTICPACRDNLHAHTTTPRGSFMLAAGMGTAVALAGTGVWWAITKFTGYEFGLLAVGIGIMVGKAVQRGAGMRPGVHFQVLAVALTYLSIVGAYVPVLLKAMTDGTDEPSPLTLSRFVTVVLIAMAAPFLQGIKNALGILIIGFGLWEAWRYSRVTKIDIAGPYQLRPASPPALP
jgi:hypothetical protein